MDQVRKSVFNVTYNKHNMTAVITPYLVSITYKDAVAGKSDEVQLELSNASGIWQDEWYPDPGDTLDVTMGFDGVQMPCGSFEIDEVEIERGPDLIVMKGIAAGVKNTMNTRRSDQHENKTLAQVVKKVAERNGYTVTGQIAEIGQLVRETQLMETDLAFLKRMADTYGHVFSVRGTVITFSSMYVLEALAAAVSIDYADLLKGSNMKDKSYDTWKKVHNKHYDNDNKKVMETEFEFPVITNADGFSYNGIVRKDVKEIRLRADNSGHGLAKAIAALHSSNSRQQEGKLVVNGNPYLISGNNTEVTGWGKLSGIYHIYASVNKETEAGYISTAEVKRVGYVDVVKTKRKKAKKELPVTVSVVR